MTRRKKYFILLGTGMAAMGLGAFAVYWFGLPRGIYPSPKRFPVRGLDLSHHQNKVNWQKLRENQIEFVYLKATEGGDFVDPSFKKRWRDARAAGMATGAYHFFSFCVPAKKQADNFMSVVPAEPDALPPAIDLEFGGNCRKVPTRNAVIASLTIFTQALVQQYGQRPVYYVTPAFFDMYMKDNRWRFPPHRLWIRSILLEPSYTPCEDEKDFNERGWTFWQYASRGRVAGVDSIVDMNAFCGEAADFEKLSSNSAVEAFSPPWHASGGGDPSM